MSEPLSRGASFLSGRSRRWGLRWTAALVISLALLLAAGLRGFRIVGRDSPTHSGVPAAWKPEGEPENFRVVYRVWERGGGTLTDELTVRRPYWSHSISSRDGVVVSESMATAEGHFIHELSSGRWLQIPDTGVWSAFDYRPLLTLPWLQKFQLVKVYGLGRHPLGPCLRMRIGNSPGELPAPPRSADYADLCVSTSGVILREEWVVDGVELRRREAVEFSSSGVLSLDQFRLNGGVADLRAPEDQLVDDPHVAKFLTKHQFTLVGRRSALEPTAGFRVTYRCRKGIQIVEVVAVDDGSTEELVGTNQVELAPGYRGVFRVALWGSELAVRVGERHYVVRGPDPDVVLETGRRLGSAEER